LCFGGLHPHNAQFDTVEELKNSQVEWSLLDSKMCSRKYLLAAVVMSDGNVLVCGGLSTTRVDGTYFSSSCEIFDTSKMTFRAAAKMTNARIGHAAVLLPNGDVLVTGGYDASKKCLISCEYYSPILNMWSEAPSLHTPRSQHGCILLPNNTVMVFGGRLTATCEMLNLSSQQWSCGIDMPAILDDFAYSLI